MNSNVLKTKHGEIQLPAFMPDATYGSIRSTSFKDAYDSGVREIVTTTLHIEQKIGSEYIKKIGGINKFFNWERPILTDSGGWQVFSLINSEKGNKKNKISEIGCSFVDPDTGEFSLLTPESSIQIQANLSPDIMTVLDNPIIGKSSLAKRKESVRINTIWAKRAKTKFKEIYQSKEEKPLLGSVIQGGDDFVLRKQSAEELVEIDFDLFNFGGIPLNEGTSWKNFVDKGNFYREMLHFVSELIPENKIKYAMGVGQPDDIAFCYEHGWNLFDTVLPTRNARHGYLYVNKGVGDKSKGYISDKTNKDYFYDIMHLRTERYKFDDKPVDENCNCECCSTVSRAYLRHLIRINEPAGYRLTTIHNLRFYSNWMEELRKG
ncbi:MAG: tRNA guanosine(34) transglycosylase Tgt [Candidatus Dojkabacteria bacterium]|nr:tRNA guanosine(34) transglycosylase Tgt [Candidatus Dojkabacteria bacterium]MDQ7021487.1 tRNA guanosine(34) transglycosylase Tgt [Candidatus Dojkabacteria bacterium]